MGRTVVGDENQLDVQVDSIFRSGSSVQIGLLVGKFGSGGSRDLVFGLVPSPPKDGEEAATVGPSGQKNVSLQKGARGKSSTDAVPLQISVDWVAEHARQVSRMLLGGMSVVGIYVFSSEGSFKSSLATIWQAVMAVAAVAPSLPAPGDEPEYLMLHISSSPRRLYCRSCPKTSNFSTTSLRPCDWMLRKLSTNLQEFSCTYTIDIRFPVFIEGPYGNVEGLRKGVHFAIAVEAARLQTAQAIVDGCLVEPDQVLGSGNTLHEVELLLPLSGDSYAQPLQNCVKVAGYALFRGEIHARAYAVVRDPLSRAVADLKRDIIASLRARLELLIDEGEEKNGVHKVSGEDENVDGLKYSSSYDAALVGDLSMDDAEHSFAMPRRVFAPWLDGASICDYMLSDETLEDVQERIMDLFGVEEVAQSEVIEPENMGCLPVDVATVVTKSTDTNTKLSTAVVSKKGSLTSIYSLGFAGAALAVLIALLLSIMWMRLKDPL